MTEDEATFAQTVQNAVHRSGKSGYDRGLQFMKNNGWDTILDMPAERRDELLKVIKGETKGEAVVSNA